MTGISLSVLGILFALLGAGIYIGIALMGTGVLSLMVFRTMPVDALLGQIAWNTATIAELVALPLFILMAEILFHTKLGSQLFDALAPWTSWLPGRLVHVNVAACTLFGSVSGSSAATAATIGRITLHELDRRGYAQSLSIGSLAGAGTLGILIPPSIVMVIYCVLAQVSLLDLFLAGIIPGLVLALAFSLAIVVMVLLNPRLVPANEERFDWGDRLRSLKSLIPISLLILVVIGSMIAGIATPNESAAVGVAGALALAWWDGGLSWKNLGAALEGTVVTSSMVGLILIGAAFVAVAMGYLGVPQAVARMIEPLQLGPIGLIALLLVIYLVLGTALDGISCIVLTLPIVLPMVKAAGYDLVWFGIFLVVTVEMAEVTPPVGFNMFVIQGLTRTTTAQVAIAALPFFLVMLAFAALIVAFPSIVMVLPNLVR
jgi:C4-dicarboxylate transporter, DctM subunit